MKIEETHIGEYHSNDPRSVGIVIEAENADDVELIFKILKVIENHDNKK